MEVSNSRPFGEKKVSSVNVLEVPSTVRGKLLNMKPASFEANLWGVGNWAD
jgi:hypothetical protein